ncbi:shufflon system plasmid conjugative transfer pilus tip adhesin PilV, partial [Pseudomonas aeruginosa]
KSVGGGSPTCEAFNIPGYDRPIDVTTYACPIGYTKIGWDTTGQGWRYSRTPGLTVGQNDWATVFCCKF